MNDRSRTARGTSAALVAAGSATAAWLFEPGSAWAQAPVGPEGYHYGPHMMWGGSWFGMLFGPIFLLLLLVAVVGALALAGRWFSGPHHHAMPSPRREPLDILKERFARGEIDKEAFEERRRVLGE